MHDLDADVGVSGQESGLKLYILPQCRGFTPTMRVKSPHAQKPGREYLNNVQTPLWLAFLLGTPLGASGDMKQGENLLRRWGIKIGVKAAGDWGENTLDETGLRGEKMPPNIMSLTSLRCWPCWKRYPPSRKTVVSRKAIWEMKTNLLLCSQWYH